MKKNKKNDVRDKMDAKINRAIKKAGQRECFVIYSVYEEDENFNPIDNLDEIAAKGRVRLVSDRDEFFGGRHSKDYRSKLLINPTWLDVAVCANEMIGVVLDEHHCFLEGIELKERKGNVFIYELCMGS